MHRTRFVLGMGIGYVLGARAGRDRYEQIVTGARAVWTSSPVAELRARAEEALGDRAVLAGWKRTVDLRDPAAPVGERMPGYPADAP